MSRLVKQLGPIPAWLKRWWPTKSAPTQNAPGFRTELEWGKVLRLSLLGLTALVALATTAGFLFLDLEKLASYGSILSAAAGMLAVIWFTGSLFYQSRQLREQRSQFLEQFKSLRQDGRRNALLLCRDILSQAEARALSLNPDIKSLSELFLLYMQVPELKCILESDDPTVVGDAVKEWSKKEGPAMTIMHGLKNAAEIYFSAVGQNNIDYNRDPDEFVYVYGSLLWKLPFFQSFNATASALSEIMVLMVPARKSVTLAGVGVALALGTERILKMDKLREDVATHCDKGYPLPKIMEGLRPVADN